MTSFITTIIIIIIIAAVIIILIVIIFFGLEFDLFKVLFLMKSFYKN